MSKEIKTFTATHLNKHAQEVFAAAKDGPVMIKHDRYQQPFIIRSSHNGALECVVRIEEAFNSEIIGTLIDYLSSHETDISASINDFGELKEVFATLIGRYAGNEDTSC